MSPVERYAIGLDMGGTNIRCAAVTPSGRVLMMRRSPSHAGRGAAEIADNIAASVRALEEAARAQGLGRPLALGVAVPGPLDLRSGTVMAAPHVSAWRSFALRAALEARLHRRVTLENDANAWALGEFWKGAARGRRDVVLLTLGTGVGGGIIVDGRLVYGRSGMAGELGHVTVEPGGLRCDCGARGCLESYASAAGLRRQVESRLRLKDGRPLPRLFVDRFGVFTVRRLVAAARADNLLARAVLAVAGRYLGIAVGSFLNIFNPELVVIGGGVSGALPLMRRAMMAEVRARSFAVALRQVKIVRAALGEKGGVVGAAFAAMHQKV